MVLGPALVRHRSLLQSCWAPTAPTEFFRAGFHPAPQKLGLLHRKILSLSVREWHTHITIIKILLLVARIPCPQPSEAVQCNPALCDLLETSGSQYLLTSLCSVSQYLVFKAVVSLSLLHRGKKEFSHLCPSMLFPINAPREWWLPKPPRKGREAGRGCGGSPLGEQIWFSGGVGRCAESLCQDSALGVWHSLVSRVKGVLMEWEMLGGKTGVILQDT